MSNIDKLEAALMELTNFEGKAPTLYRDRDYADQIVLSAEEGDGYADYYGSNNGWPTVDERVERIAKQHGFYFEWENAGALIAYEI